MLQFLRRGFALLLLALLGSAQAGAQVANGALQGVLGANKFDLSSQYLGFASNGDGSAPYMAVLPAMGRRAIADAGDKGLSFLRVMAAGYGPSNPSQINQPAHNELLLWQSNPVQYWSRLDAMFNDLAAYNVKIVPVFVWNPYEFPTVAGESLANMIVNPASRSRGILKQYISEFVGRYKQRRAIKFYELTNELNLEADIDVVGLCRKSNPSAPTNCKSMGNFTTAQMNAFAASMVAFIKSLDPLHAVDSGYTMPRPAAYHLMLQPGFSAKGADWTADSQAQFTTMEALLHAPFDIVSIHLYPGDVRWGNPVGTEYLTLDAAAAAAKAQGKRLYVGEFGARTIAPFFSSILPRLVLDRVAFASVWVWEFYQVSPWQSSNLTFGKDSSLEPGFTGAINGVLANAAGPATFADPGTPRVVITAPLACATISGATRLYAAASASTPVQRVTFTVDGLTVGSSSATPYSVPFTVMTRGVHRIGATAYAGSHKASTAINVLFQSGGGCTVVPQG